MPKHYRNFPRKIIHKRPSWCVEISVSVKGGDNFSHKIFLGAFYGGEAKNKALPKIQSFLGAISRDSKKRLMLYIVLKKVSKKGRDGTPTYILKERYRYPKELLLARCSSRVFKVQ